MAFAGLCNCKHFISIALRRPPRQAMSVSEVAIELPLQTVDSDEVDNATDGQAASVFESAEPDQIQISTEHCWNSGEVEDEKETEEQIDNSSRDTPLLQPSPMAPRVDALEARDVHEEAARIVMARLDHLSGARGQELDPGSAAPIADSQLVVFGAVKAFGGLMLKSMCDGRGWEVTCHGDLVF